MPPEPVLVARGSDRVHFHSGVKCAHLNGPGERLFSGCRGVKFSADGSKFAWVTATHVYVAETGNWTIILQLELPKVADIKFSPTSSLFCVWHPLFVSKQHPSGYPNMHVHCLDTGECIKSLTHKRFQTWEPQWTRDDGVCGRLMTNEVHFFEQRDWSAVSCRLRVDSVASFSLCGGGAGAAHVVVFVPSIAGRAATARLYKYGNFGDDCVVARKSFFKADAGVLKWNCRGTCCLVLASTESDSTGQSYYGETSLYGLDTRGNAVHLQPGSKAGPIYSVEWSPCGGEFCVVYGYMPACATIFNVKCDAVFQFEPDFRNSVHYNPHGDLLVLAGSGNVRGRLEVWAVRQRRLVARADCADTTELHWAPDGRHLVTATCSPRLRQGNCFRVWHYTLSLQFERLLPDSLQLYETCWQPASVTAFPQPDLPSSADEEKKHKVAGIKSQRTKPAVAYIPPVLREQAKLGPGQRRKAPIPGMSIEPEAGKKSRARSNKKNEDRQEKTVKQSGSKADEDDEPFVPPGSDDPVTCSSAVTSAKCRPQEAAPSSAATDRKKRREVLKKKLKDIGKLKGEQSAGKQLNQDQLDKLSREAELVAELKKLAV